MKSQSRCRPRRWPAQARGAAGLLVVVLLIAAALVAWGLISRHRADAELRHETEQQGAMPVSVVQPRQDGSSQALTLPGNVQAYVEAPIHARTSGYLKRWYVDIGGPVKAGQVLADIDTPEVDQQLRQAEADLANAEANDRIAQTTAERWRGLRASDSVSKQEADEKISAAEASRAAVKAARANVQRLRELSGFSQVIAPFDGIVTARNTDVGQLITPGGGPSGALFRVADTEKLRVYVRVPQPFTASMRPGIEAQLAFPDRPGRSYAAELVRTSSALDETSRTLLVELEMDNAQQELLPGAYVDVRFDLPASLESALRLPSNTLLFRGDGLKVATVGQDDKVHLKSVTVGRDFGTEIEVTTGLDAGDRVIMAPSDSITEGAAVRIAQPPQAEPTQGEGAKS